MIIFFHHKKITDSIIKTSDTTIGTYAGDSYFIKNIKIDDAGAQDVTENYQFDLSDASYTITNATFSAPTIMLNGEKVENPKSPNRVTYTGSAHQVEVIPSATIFGDTATVKYALNPYFDTEYTGSYSEEIPQIKDAGKYEIWYLIEEANYTSYTGYFIVTVEKAELIISVKPKKFFMVIF